MPASFSQIVSGADLWQWRQGAISRAIAAEIDPAEVDWFLEGLCQVDRLALQLGTIATQPAIATRCHLAVLETLWQQRLRDRVPVQHLVGFTPWRTFHLAVSSDVLIPRPETELIIDLAIQAVQQHPQRRVLETGTWVDLGTGSGAIALGLATAFPEATILAVDISEAALEIAQQNALTHGLGDRIEFFQGSWFAPLENYAGKLAGMVANPPYIPHDVIPSLQPEITRHEPHLALDGGADGLTCVYQLIQQAPQYLMPGGVWLVELMVGQAAVVVDQLAKTHAYTPGQICLDLTQRDRFVLAQTVYGR